jgi:hypothetical protein
LVSLREFRTDTKAVNDGEWVPLRQYGDLEIQSRGFTDDFVDAQTERLAKAAEPYQNNAARVPNSALRQLNASLLEDHLIIGVRNLVDENGEPVTLQAFHALLYDPAYNKLMRACWDAAQSISTRSLAQLDAARGNSQKPSTTISNGATSESG